MPVFKPEWSLNSESGPYPLKTWAVSVLNGNIIPILHF